ncbi:uncharacterized protein L969DRAFT_19320 [Mixia osmundae IAM 14324]|uniref:uncharacterized protein n=1 Tax=Mixia osmundae (strain CBS 9802 / IAM 14324 / JCM 22182 / KY 12970) TaxID=764103 RepID=UPI0004A555A4|nr:uncharacterized protein L969DRAFT_19320 [Mixia osmundae IAM 14324]KEI37271.1 hypothetical protein L969DRAFT_19320 [Mixia osmundae IAM 14324]
MAKDLTDVEEPLLPSSGLHEPSRNVARAALIRTLLAICTLLVAVGLFGGFASLVLVRHRSGLPSHAWSFNQIWSMVSKTGQHRTTLVSALFMNPNDTMRHSPGQYYVWLDNFLKTNEQPIVFYTSPDLVERVQAAHGPSTEARPLQIVPVASAFELPPIVKLGGLPWLEQQWLMDPEQRIHSKLMYAVWMSKAWFVEQVSRNNPYNSERFFWIDAGVFRDSDEIRFSELDDRLDEAFGIHDDRLMLSAVENLPSGSRLQAYHNASDWPLRANLIQGAWFGGAPAPVSWWAEEMHRVASTQIALGRFAAKEQDIMNLAALINMPRLLILTAQKQKGNCGFGPWFVFWKWCNAVAATNRCEPEFFLG